MKPTERTKPFRIGILGGMGPLAGVELHRLIIEAVNASRDQGHVQVMLFTNPQIPDRTESLRDNDGQAFAKAAGESVAVLAQAGVDVITLACMTAHSRLAQIQTHTTVPILNGISLVRTALHMHYNNRKVALLATSGSIQSKVYTSSIESIDWLLPNAKEQALITNAIYTIKSGSVQSGGRLLLRAITQLQARGADTFVLGCTELGLLFADLQDRGLDVIDPMRLIANQVAILHELSVVARPAGATTRQ